MNFCAILFARSSISSFDVEVNIFPFIIIVSRRETIFLISVSFHGFKILFSSVVDLLLSFSFFLLSFNL